MAKTTITSFSDEMGPNQAPNYAPLKTNVYAGRLRILFFTKTYGTEAAGDNAAVGVLPKGARIITGQAMVSATTGSATLSFGLAGKDGSGYINALGTVDDAVAALKAAAAITSTAKVELAATQALLGGYETEKELYVTVTTAAAAMAGQKLTGYLLYVVD